MLGSRAARRLLKVDVAFGCDLYLVGELRVSPRNFRCGVSLPGCAPGEVGVDERVEGASGTPPGFSHFPKTLGVLLMIGSGGYLADLVAIHLSPGFESSLSQWLVLPAALAEILFLLWLLILGAKVAQRDEQIPAAEAAS
jgi:hypothetical protein